MTKRKPKPPAPETHEPNGQPPTPAPPTSPRSSNLAQFVEPTIKRCATPLEQVIDWLIQGNTEGDIVAACETHYPHLKPAALIHTAVDKIRDDADIDRQLLLGWCLLARRELYRQMLETGDLPGALSATKSIESLAEKLST